jgi:diaminopimelate decarboxylase
MKNTDLPFSVDRLRALSEEYGTPIYIYDELGLRNKARKIAKAFAWEPGYRNYYAVKACPNPKILQILFEEGMGFDCSSRTELLLMQRMSIPGDRVFFTSNNTPKEDFELAIDLGAIVNIDDLTQVRVFAEIVKGKGYQLVACRYNPGDQKDGNEIIGKPSEAKYGMSLDQLVEAYTLLKDAGVQKFGLHTMVASNELNTAYFADTARLVLDAMNRIENEAGVEIALVNLGGGFGLNYRPDQAEFDIQTCSKLIEQEFGEIAERVQLCTENGRYVTGPHGYLLTGARYIMDKYKSYVGVDASMHNLMRPGMYGAYHHITVVGAENRTSHKYDIVGSLCENNDKFAIDRELPKVTAGDLLVVHDVGAHGHAMGFNYNGLLKSAEVLVCEDGTSRLIRRAETPDDLFATIVW